MRLARATTLLVAAMVVASSGTVVVAATATPATAGSASTACQAVDPSATIDHEGENLTLQTESNQTITGSTTLEPGTEISVTLRGTGEQPFLRSYRRTVDEDGRFAVTVDLQDLDAGAVESATVTVSSGGEELTRLPLTLEPGPGPEPDRAYTTENCEDEGGPDERGPDDGEPAEPGLETNVVQVSGGDTAAITVSVDGDGEVLLTVGAEHLDHDSEFLLEDRDGDGTVTLLVNTTGGGPNGTGVDARDDADVVGIPVDSESIASEGLPPGDYQLIVSADISGDGDVVDVGTLVVVDEDVTAGSEPGDSQSNASDGTREDDGNTADRPASPSVVSSASPSVLGLTAIAVVSFGIVATVTLFRR